MTSQNEEEKNKIVPNNVFAAGAVDVLPIVIRIRHMIENTWPPDLLFCEKQINADPTRSEREGNAAIPTSWRRIDTAGKCEISKVIAD